MKARLLFIDNIRWVLIAVVISHHAAVTYSHIGGWYYVEGPKPPLSTSFPLALFELFNQSYFMGILFLLAGYFVPRAFETKGAWRFMRDRVVRLGIPTLFFMLAIDPFTVYWLLRKFAYPTIPSLTNAYIPFLTTGKVFSATGPMWFAAALLIFCGVYAGVRMIYRPGATMFLPGQRSVIGLIALMGTCSFLVRIVQPVGTNILNMQLCYFSQYILLFAVGTAAYHGDWLRRIPYSFGMFWWKLALWVGGISLPIILLTSGVFQGDTERLLGGWHWESAVFCFWEAFFCVGACLGLITIFRERFNTQGKFVGWLSQNSFSAYLFHTPILVAISLCFREWHASPLVKFGVVSLLAVPITFLVSGAIRTWVPGLRRLL